MVFIYLSLSGPKSDRLSKGLLPIGNSQLQISVNGFTPPSAVRTGIWSYAHSTVHSLWFGRSLVLALQT